MPKIPEKTLKALKGSSLKKSCTASPATSSPLLGSYFNALEGMSAETIAALDIQAILVDGVPVLPVAQEDTLLAEAIADPTDSALQKILNSINFENVMETNRVLIQASKDEGTGLKSLEFYRERTSLIEASVFNAIIYEILKGSIEDSAGYFILKGVVRERTRANAAESSMKLEEKMTDIIDQQSKYFSSAYSHENKSMNESMIIRTQLSDLLNSMENAQISTKKPLEDSSSDASSDIVQSVPASTSELKSVSDGVIM